MKMQISTLRKLVLATLAVSPAFAFAAVPASSAYNTDKTNSYVQDQTTQAMSQLNNILCYMGAMDPAEMVNLSTNSGNYIALVDDNVCDPNSGGGKGGNTNSGSSYQPVVVNSSRADNASPMIVKVWIKQPQQSSNISVYASATQAPNPPSDPYGRFRMDYVQTGGQTGQGFISATASGLDFYQYGSGSGGGGGTYTDELKLKLNTSTSTTGSGALSKVTTFNGSPFQSSTFSFAYDGTSFLRTDSNGANPQCFSRDPLQAAESVWSYGLYDSGNGDRISRKSGFPIEYTDAGGATQNGYVGYYGLWAPTAVPAGAMVQQVSYNGGSATKTPYTLLQTGGKLLKFTKVNTTLDGLDKVKFQFWPQVSVPGVAIPSTPSSLSTGTTYEVYWDKGAGNFVISGQQDTSSFNMVPYATTATLSIADMKLAAPYGLYGWSQMLGGDFAIDYLTMQSLSASSIVVTHAQDVVYPADFATLLAGGLKCLDQCPTAADITASNTVGSTASPFGTTNTWTGNTPGKGLYGYTLDPATGNLMDTAATPAAVVSTANQSTADAGTTSANNAWGIRSGRLVAAADVAQLDTALGLRSGTASQYIESDIDSLTTYYQWTTSGNNWDQLAILNDAGGTPVRFDPPLNVTYTVPAGAQYGTFSGANIVLQYSGFGDLWGIPSTCVDITTNAACVLSGGSTTPNQNQRWTPQFSIPAGASVTVATTQGTVAANTSYLVKALDMEVRLANITGQTGACSGLTTGGAVTLPTSADWQDPTAKVGTAPTFTTVPAPQVIQGVKMY